MKRCFEVLNVKPGSDLSEVKRAYRKAVQKYHPDSNGGIGNPYKFKEVVKAYKTIQNHYKVLGIKPAQPHSVFSFKIFGALFKKSKPVTAQVLRKKRLYDRTYVDPVLMNLTLAELALRLTESDNDFVRKQGARAMAIVYGAEAVPVLHKTLLNAHFDLAEEIIFSLGLIDHYESANVLEKYMRHNNVKIACTAVNALANINRHYSRKPLKRIEREGRSFLQRIRSLFDNRNLLHLVQSGLIEKSEYHIAQAIRRTTRESLPIILRELGWVLPESI